MLAQGATRRHVLNLELTCKDPIFCGISGRLQNVSFVHGQLSTNNPPVKKQNCPKIEKRSVVFEFVSIATMSQHHVLNELKRDTCSSFIHSLLCEVVRLAWLPLRLVWQNYCTVMPPQMLNRFRPRHVVVSWLSATERSCCACENGESCPALLQSRYTSLWTSRCIRVSRSILVKKGSNFDAFLILFDFFRSWRREATLRSFYWAQLIATRHETLERLIENLSLSHRILISVATVFSAAVKEINSISLASISLKVNWTVRLPTGKELLSVQINCVSTLHRCAE